MSQLPSDLPQMPKWPFLCTDVALLLVAALIADNARGPLSGWELVAVLSCVFLAAILCAIPFLTEYARKQDQALDERQRSLESLNRSVANSAEQVAIAVQGLKRLDEQFQDHLPRLEQVPGELGRKLGELQRALAVVNDLDGERLGSQVSSACRPQLEQVATVVAQLTALASDLDRRLAAAGEEQLGQSAELRGSLGALSDLLLKGAELEKRLAAARELDAQRLAQFSGLLDKGTRDTEATQQAVLSKGAEVSRELSARLEKVLAELARVEQSVSSQISAAATQLLAIDQATTAAAAKLEGVVSQSAVRTGAAAAEAMSESRIAIDSSLAAAHARLASELDARLAQGQALLRREGDSSVRSLEALLGTHLEQSEAAFARIAASISEDVSKRLAFEHEQLLSKFASLAASAAKSPVAEAPAEVSSPVEEQALAGACTPDLETSVVAQPVALPFDNGETALTAVVSDAALSAAPVPAAEARIVAPSELPAVADDSRVAAVVSATPVANPVSHPKPTEKAQKQASIASAPSVMTQQRAPKRRAEGHVAGSGMDLFNDSFSLEEELHREPLISRSFSSDGATRIMVASFPGAGSRLFIRGSGPGLSWDKGQPLQSVSPGKWRWESLEVEASFRFKLYKNDQIECCSLGEQPIEAGQQAEVIANF